jgi:hypothetical protein
MNLLFNKSVLLLVLSALPYISATAQKTKSNPKVFIARVAMIDNTRAKGVLYSVSDTTIVLIPLTKGTSILDGKDTVVIRTRDVKHIRIRRKAAVRRGMLIGLSTGVAVGAIVGAVTYDECEGVGCVGAGPTAAGVAILGALPGAVVGAIIGSYSRRFKINGQLLTQEQKTDLEKFASH